MPKSWALNLWSSCIPLELCERTCCSWKLCVWQLSCLIPQISHSNERWTKWLFNQMMLMNSLIVWKTRKPSKKQICMNLQLEEVYNWNYWCSDCMARLLHLDHQKFHPQLRLALSAMQIVPNQSRIRTLTSLLWLSNGPENSFQDKWHQFIHL